MEIKNRDTLKITIWDHQPRHIKQSYHWRQTGTLTEQKIERRPNLTKAYNANHLLT
jgi:hypothetical protein